MGFKTFVGEHSSTILTIAGITGSIAAIFLAAKAGAKTVDDLEEAHKDSEEVPAKTKAKIIAKNFWPVAAVESLSIFATLGSNHIRDVKTTAALASANLATTALNDYRNEVKAQLGENTDRKVRDGVAQKKINDDYESNNGQMPTPINAPQVGDVLCKDSITGRYFWSTPEKLHRAENTFVSDMADEFSNSLNEWYDKLAIEGVASGIGDMLEWTTDDHFSLYLNTSMTPDERPCIYVEYNPYPHERKRYMGDY